jgi:phosphatidylglycerophosphatase A
MGMLNSLVKTLATFFYAGFFPLVPGTFASLFGLILIFLIKGNIPIYLMITVTLLILGFLVAGKAERIFQHKDSRYIVIDEVAGVFLCLAFIPYDIRLLFIGFFLFRLLDTLKPFPAGRLQNLKGSLGIMIDDIVAAFYTNIILQIIFRLASFKTS